MKVELALKATFDAAGRIEKFEIHMKYSHQYVLSGKTVTDQ
jgi:hypothetical protein